MANHNPLGSLADLIGGSSAGQHLTSITEQLQELKGINDLQAQDSRAAMAQSKAPNSASSGSLPGSLLNDIGSGIGAVLGGGLGLVPLISGLADLFGGGGDQSSPSALTQYLPPLGIQLEAGMSGSSTFATDTVQGGLPRPVMGPAPAATPQITVQVQAMDSKSFLDHSQDIANAVRQAMLETTVLNDVIREL